MNSHCMENYVGMCPYMQDSVEEFIYLCTEANNHTQTWKIGINMFMDNNTRTKTNLSTYKTRTEADCRLDTHVYQCTCVVCEYTCLR